MRRQIVAHENPMQRQKYQTTVIRKWEQIQWKYRTNNNDNNDNEKRTKKIRPNIQNNFKHKFSLKVHLIYMRSDYDNPVCSFGLYASRLDVSLSSVWACSSLYYSLLFFFIIHFPYKDSFGSFPKRTKCEWKWNTLAKSVLAAGIYGNQKHSIFANNTDTHTHQQHKHSTQMITANRNSSKHENGCNIQRANWNTGKE